MRSDQRRQMLHRCWFLLEQLEWGDAHGICTLRYTACYSCPGKLAPSHHLQAYRPDASFRNWRVKGPTWSACRCQHIPSCTISMPLCGLLKQQQQGIGGGRLLLENTVTARYATKCFAIFDDLHGDEPPSLRSWSVPRLHFGRLKNAFWCCVAGTGQMAPRLQDIRKRNAYLKTSSTRRSHRMLSHSSAPFTMSRAHKSGFKDALDFFTFMQDQT